MHRVKHSLLFIFSICKLIFTYYIIPINKKKRNEREKSFLFCLYDSAINIITLNPPPFCGSLPRKSLISRMDWVSCAGDINLPYNKILTYILRSIFLEIPHLELPRWWKTPRDTNVNDIRLLICLTPLQVNWVMEIN
jgi:hypothetical protein